MITQEQLPMVAIPSMNDTHLEEIIIVNKLDNAAKNNDISAVSEILNELLEHTIEHFSTENEMMEKAKFPAYDTHKAEHDRHLHELKALVKYFEKTKDPRAITIHIEGNLEKWLIHHIQTMDTVTAQFLAQNHTAGSY
ncbi:MAG: hemerythrin family protein [Helicobacteraceae bacterium]|nr:hemerythrin family protein [Candidatus Sulfurimonas ponti]MBL6973030.1 hemerythrin family protein [Sulfurimonas sp.]